MQLRDYQTKAVEAVMACWKTHRSCLLVLPTGCGKTVVFAEIVRRILAGESRAAGTSAPTKGCVMILAHREELIRQGADKVERQTGVTPAIEMGPYKVEDYVMMGEVPRVVVSSVQTQVTGRMGKFLPEDFAAVIVDEAHHATSPSYRETIGHYLENPDCRLLGVTATPDRADETALGTVFEAVAYEYSVQEAINDGWLVPVKQKLVNVDGLDYSHVSTTAGDLNQGELAEVLEEERALHAIAAPTLEICGKRRAIVFAVTVKQAERLCEIINRHSDPDNPIACWVSGKTPKKEREDTLKRFAEGKYQFVVNVGVLTEGFDDAGVEVVVMARPTKSRALYAQMAGRATRPAAEIAGLLGECGDGGVPAPSNCGIGAGTPSSPQALRRAMIAHSSKPHCLIVDFVGNSGRHKLVTTADILGGKDLDPNDEAVKIAKRRAAESPDGVDIAAEIEKARAEIERRKLLDAAARRDIVLTAYYHETPVDPFDLFAGRTVLAPTENPWHARPLSYKQDIMLRNNGIDPSKHALAANHAVLDEMFRRRARGLATYQQTRFLQRHGFVMPMTKAEASRTIAAIKGGL